MTISTTANQVSFAGNGTTDDFATGFKFYANSDLTVIIVTDSTGAESTKVLDTDYTVTGAGSDSGGTVTMVVAPAVGETLVIKRDQPYTQGLDLVENDPFPSDSVEETLDKIVVMTQQNSSQINRSLRQPDGDTADIDRLPAKVTRATKVLGFDSDGDPVASTLTLSAIESGSTDAAASAAAAAASAAAAAASEAAAATTYDNFDDRYLGAKASDPTLDNDGDALIDGALYFDTTLNVMKFYDLGNTAWKQTTPTSADQTNIDATVANASNINAVAAIDTDVTTVAGISSDVTTVAADGTDIGTVAGISANVTTVAGISSDVTTVAGISGDVSSVAAQVIGYDFSTTTAMADPGSGNVRFNNATVASVTAIAIDDLDKNGVDQSAYIALFDDSTNTVKGTLVFRTGGGDVATFNITGLTDNTGWFQIAVTHVASSGTFADGEDTFIGFTRAGDKGADGAGSGDISGPGSATDNAVVRWDGTSGQLVQNSGVTINDSGDLTANNFSGTHSGTSSGTNTGDEVAASESTAGVVELATTAEAEAGTDTVRAVTPAGAAAAIAALATSVNPNLIINGDMRIAQRGTVASISGASYGGPDRFQVNLSGVANLTLEQNSDAPANTQFKNSLRLTVGTGDALGTASDFVLIRTMFEGQDLAQFKKGTTNAESMTLTFWVRSAVTGTYIANLRDNDNSRHVSLSYTVDSANTWEFKTLTFPADTTGAFDDDNGRSLIVQWFVGAGTDYTSGTLATTWAAQTAANQGVGQVNGVATTSNIFALTGVKLEVGSTATDFVPDNYGTALAKCQRYYCETGTGLACYLSSASQNFVSDVYPVEMRAAPTITLLDTSPTIQGATAEETGSSSAIDFSNIGTLGAALRINGFTQTTGESGFMANGTTKVFAHSAEL